MFCAISISCAASRATWAFARDKALPFSRVFAKVAIPPMTKEPLPVNAFLLSTAVQVLLGLIYLGSSTAFNAFVSVSVICLGSSYAMPVAISLAGRRRLVKNAPYSLGRWGAIINAIAVAWILFAIVLFCMPTVIPPTPTTMSEYRCVTFHVILVLIAFVLDRLRIRSLRRVCALQRRLVPIQSVPTTFIYTSSMLTWSRWALPLHGSSTG